MFETNYTEISMLNREVRRMPEQMNKLEAPRGDGEKILVVEDEEMLRDFLQAVLSENGYEVILATDGTEGVRKFAQYMDEIHLVLLDMGLPGLSGEEVLSMIVALRSYAKVIAVSGSIEPEVQVVALQMGASGYLSKPYLTEDLLERVHQAIHSGVHLDS